MGLFRVTGRLTGPAGRSEDAELFVGTGATLLVVPRSLAERPELAVRRSQPVLTSRWTRPLARNACSRLVNVHVKSWATV